VNIWPDGRARGDVLATTEAAETTARDESSVDMLDMRLPCNSGYAAFYINVYVRVQVGAHHDFPWCV
jgi:hypothetical protein